MQRNDISKTKHVLLFARRSFGIIIFFAFFIVLIPVSFFFGLCFYSLNGITHGILDFTQLFGNLVIVILICFFLQVAIVGVEVRVCLK